ncbi:MAG: OmpA family protein [Bacteroidota bacterium]
MKHFLALALLFVALLVNGQNPADCPSAKRIQLPYQPSYTIFDVAPQGGGNLKEIQAPAFDKNYFRREHHTVWYVFKAPGNGVMEFEIFPKDTLNDYDFILFEAKGEDPCEAIRRKEVAPLRSVISRNDKRVLSQTGLLRGAEESHIHQGPGESYAPPVKVKEGEEYYLVLDNVYGGGEGHWITFRFRFDLALIGEVYDKESRAPLEADVQLILKDSTWDRTLSDPTSGSFAMEWPSRRYQGKVNLTIGKKGYFPEKTQVSFSRIRQKKPRPIKIYLTPIKAGNTFVLKELNFYGGRATVLPYARPILRQLLEIMQQNPALTIEIQGHVNGVNVRDDENAKYTLSVQRAETVRNYLLTNGIDSKRMTTKGFSDKKMPYPQAKTPKELELNRRVEIMVTSD